MSKLRMIIAVILFLIIIIVLFVFALRFYNDKKYSNRSISTYDYYKNVTDINLYPKYVEGVDIKYINKKDFQGFHMIPKKRLHNGIIVCYGGSEGSPNFEEATRLAKEGYESLAVFMFGMKNQPKTLVKIPLEQFEGVLNYINENIKDKYPITVLGASKGAEYVLNLATKYDEISNIILFSPSAYTFAGLDFKNYGSSWSYKNKELPYIDIKKSSFINLIKNIIIPSLIKSPVQYKGLYESAINKDLDNYAKLIPAKNIKAKILMFVGEDDQMWCSNKMAKIIKEENKNSTIVLYKNAGHIFYGDGIINTPENRIIMGGHLSGNENARKESNKAIDRFLQYNSK